MFHLSQNRTDLLSRNRTTETHYKCPECKMVESFYNYPPKVCDNCGFFFGDVLQLHTSLQLRIDFYRDGGN